MGLMIDDLMNGGAELQDWECHPETHLEQACLRRMGSKDLFIFAACFGINTQHA
jgi:hypothetical protein